MTRGRLPGGGGSSIVGKQETRLYEPEERLHSSSRGVKTGAFCSASRNAMCVQETRWKSEEVVEIKDYKLWYLGSRIAQNGVGIFLGKLHKGNVVDVGRFSDRIMSVSLIIKEETFTVISAYAPHAGLGDAEKKSFWDFLEEVVRGCPADHRLIIGGWSEWTHRSGGRRLRGSLWGLWFGPRNEAGRSILEFAIAHELVVANSFFKRGMLS
ncbi:uncharacterized protein [Rutidosis leptorrhynchoides]|uniref:uncharacterized protein n=1 Tax=Rutidosis leptorrhynchoides TaxID=125765 RepID=UPI003A997C29